MLMDAVNNRAERRCETFTLDRVQCAQCPLISNVVMVEKLSPSFFALAGEVCP